ncbi:MAG: hypothetical protein CM15mP62_05990 [Rhodospirillaceae bacterium]|nr:MAG: hypothetical protein CM15mP62_05990 [Rhodospirillaceae bacterium]
MPEKVDCVVIGAGVVGLACARELAMAGREVIILEQADAIGTETSSGTPRSFMQVFTMNRVV